MRKRAGALVRSGIVTGGHARQRLTTKIARGRCGDHQRQAEVTVRRAFGQGDDAIHVACSGNLRWHARRAGSELGTIHVATTFLGQVDVAVLTLRGKARADSPCGVVMRDRPRGLDVIQNALLLGCQFHRGFVEKAGPAAYSPLVRSVSAPGTLTVQHCGREVGAASLTRQRING